MSNFKFQYYCRGLLVDSHKNISNVVNHFVPGVQSVGLNESMPVVQIKDVGKSQVLKNLSTEPEHQITVERVLSNLDKLWLEKSSENLWDSSNFTGSNQYQNSFLLKPENFGMSIPGFDSGTKSAIQQKILPEYTLRLIYAPEDTSVIGSSGLSGNALDVVELPYSLMRSLSYNFSVDSPVTETIEFSSKVLERKQTTAYNFDTRGGDKNSTTSTYVNVLRREHFDTTLSVFPSTISALTNYNKIVGASKAFGITGIELSIGFDYQQFVDIGKWRGEESANYDELNMFTCLTCPLNISCRFTLEAARSQQSNIRNVDTNFGDERICLVAKIKNYEDNNFRFFVFNLGNKNRLVSLSESGGDTSGSIVEYTLEYQNSNNDFVAYTQLQAGSTTLNPSLFQQTTENY